MTLVKNQAGWFKIMAMKLYSAPVLIVLGGLFLSLLLFYTIDSEHEDVISASFEEQVEERIKAIEVEIGINLGKLNSLSGFFQVSDPLTRRKFIVFSDHLTSQGENNKLSSIHALEWIPQVPHELRATYENNARMDGFPEFNFTQRLGKNKIVKAATRQVYYPVFFIEPMAGNETAMGFDLGSDPKQLAALAQARDTNSMVATEKISLIQAKKPQPGILIFHPIYSQNSSTVEQRQNHLKGFALIVLQIGDLIHTAVDPYPEFGIEFFIFDASTQDQSFMYHYSRFDKENSHPDQIDINKLKRGFHLSETITIADRKWEIIAVATPAFYKSLPRNQRVYYLLFGLVITSLMLFISISSRKKTVRVQLMVEHRTKELSQALEDAQVARQVVADSKKQLETTNKIADIFLTVSGDAMFADILDAIMEIMQSKFGFFGYIDINGDLVCPSMTRDIMDKCQIPNKSIIFHRSDWSGIWGKSLLEKKTYVKNAELIVPQGHVQLMRALTVPIVHDTHLVGIFAVGDKKTDYNEKDVQILETIADHIAPILSVWIKKNQEEEARRVAEQNLTQSLDDTEKARERTDGILKSISDGLVVTDNYNRIVLMNRTAEDILDIRFSEVINRPVDAIITDKTLLTTIKATSDQKRLFPHIDFELSDPSSKTKKQIRARTSVMYDTSQEISGAVTIFQDVSFESAADKRSAVFILETARKFRIPLSIIQSISETMITQKEMPIEDREKHLDDINRKSADLVGIIDDILDSTIKR